MQGGQAAVTTVCVDALASARMSLDTLRPIYNCIVGAFTTSLGSRFQALIALGEKEQPGVGIYIGRKLVIGTITTSTCSVPYIRRYSEKKEFPCFELCFYLFLP